MKGKRFLAVLCALLSLTGALSLLVPSFGMQHLTYAQSHAPVGTPPPLSTYYGGPVMAGNVNVYAIFWFPGENPDMKTYMGAITHYYQDVSGNRLYNMLSEYSSKNGTPSKTTLADTYVDTKDTYPARITHADIINEVKTAIAFNNWPVGGYDNYFPVYTLPSANTDPSMGGAAHLSFGPQDNPTIYGYVFYCSSGTTNCGVPTHPNDPSGYATDGAINDSAHEQFEAATDPGNIMAAGWTDGEIGDVCTGEFGPTPYPYDNGQANQQWLNLQGTPDPYIIQEFASDSPLGCSLGTS